MRIPGAAGVPRTGLTSGAGLGGQLCSVSKTAEINGCIPAESESKGSSYTMIRTYRVHTHLSSISSDLIWFGTGWCKPDWLHLPFRQHRTSSDTCKPISSAVPPCTQRGFGHSGEESSSGPTRTTNGIHQSGLCAGSSQRAPSVPSSIPRRCPRPEGGINPEQLPPAWSGGSIHSSVITPPLSPAKQTEQECPAQP